MYKRQILSSLRELGKDPVGDCGGEGACGKCKARLMMGFLSPVTELEKTYLTPMELSAGWFLMCQRRPVADIVIDVPQRDLPQYDFQRQPLATAEKFNPAIQKVVFTMQMLPGLDLEQAFLQSLACPQIQSVRLFALQQLMELMEQQPQKMTAVIAEEDGIAEVIGVELGDTSAQQYGCLLYTSRCV